MGLIVVSVFFCMNNYKQRSLAKFIPFLIERFIQLAEEGSVHDAGGCFGWLRKAFILSLCFLV